MCIRKQYAYSLLPLTAVYKFVLLAYLGLDEDLNVRNNVVYTDVGVSSCRLMQTYFKRPFIASLWLIGVIVLNLVTLYM